MENVIHSCLTTSSFILFSYSQQSFVPCSFSQNSFTKHRKLIKMWMKCFCISEWEKKELSSQNRKTITLDVFVVLLSKSRLSIQLISCKIKDKRIMKRVGSITKNNLWPWRVQTHIETLDWKDREGQDHQKQKRKEGPCSTWYNHCKPSS